MGEGVIGCLRDTLGSEQHLVYHGRLFAYHLHSE